MAFKSKVQPKFTLDSPEALLHDLRAKKIHGPLSHQADMWRRYTNDALDKPDVALQLPTGSGKTLVGLILAEWRRQKFTEKVLYLCPTNQLVNQVAEQAEKKYGLKVSKFTGQIKSYSLKDKSDYEQCATIAISSYSALFNTNPYFSDPDIIIFDDAHASENYISSLWSLEISKYDETTKNLYKAFANVIKNEIPIIKYNRMIDEENLEDWVDKLPTPSFVKLNKDIVSLLNEYCTSGDLYYKWQMIKENLHACHCYMGTNQILIRPIIPPTLTHEAFANAKQRIYMSATLGNGGDLERLTGIKNIHRLPIPQGWETQGIGRRFFLFPEISLENDALSNFLYQAIKLTNRSVILTKNDKTSEDFKSLIQEKLKYKTFNAQDIEISKEVFTKEDNAVAIMANRYDGIDFPEDEARLLIINDLPTSTNLQENFFVAGVKANELLSERILTRVIQAMGRCTRSATDYSAIIVLGEKLVSYLLNPQKRLLLHPELQAELDFGIDNSKEVTADGFLENFELFIRQDEGWREADEGIIGSRDSFKQTIPDYYQDLNNSVKHEVEYQYKMWQGDYSSAVECARNVLSELNHQNLKGYRALWNYLAGSAAHLNNKDAKLAKNFFENAIKGAPALHWMVSLAQSTKCEISIIQESYINGIIENFEKNIMKKGFTSNKKYDKEEKFILDNIMLDNASNFEEAQKRLGEFIGFQSGNLETDGAPDPWWILSNKHCIVFEDHTEATSEYFQAIKARQVSTHDNWIRERLSVDKDIEILKVLVTSTIKAYDGALPHLKDVYLWHPKDFRDWTIKVLSELRKLRNSHAGEGGLFWIEEAKETFLGLRLNPYALFEDIKKKNAYDFFISNNK